MQTFTFPVKLNQIETLDVTLETLLIAATDYYNAEQYGSSLRLFELSLPLHSKHETKHINLIETLANRLRCAIKVNQMAATNALKDVAAEIKIYQSKFSFTSSTLSTQLTHCVAYFEKEQMKSEELVLLKSILKISSVHSFFYAPVKKRKLQLIGETMQEVVAKDPVLPPASTRERRLSLAR